MGVWTRDEIEREWLKYQKSARECGPAGNWDPFCDLYTGDATMVVSGGIEVGGREALKKWYREALGSDPMRSLHYYPVEWYMIDEHRGWLSCQFWNRMADPGDGSVAPVLLLQPAQVCGRRTLVVRGGQVRPGRHATRARWLARGTRTLPRSGLTKRLLDSRLHHGGVIPASTTRCITRRPG